jgi:hypothetical protein
MEAKGKNGQVVFDGATVTIKREGLSARMGHGSAERSFPASLIAEVVVKGSGLMTNGHVVFKLTGAPAQAVPDLSHENSIIFTKAQWPAFAPIVEAVRAAQVA